MQLTQTPVEAHKAYLGLQVLITTFIPFVVLQVKALASKPVLVALQLTHLLLNNTKPSAHVRILTN